MKRLLFLTVLIALSGCEYYYHDPVYDSRDRVIGSYEMEEHSETFNDYVHYSLWIERLGRNSDALWIDNIYDVNIRVRAYLSYDRITIPRQTVNGYEVEGEGTVYANRISFHYHVKDLYNNYVKDHLVGTAYKDY